MIVAAVCGMTLTTSRAASAAEVEPVATRALSITDITPSMIEATDEALRSAGAGRSTTTDGSTKYDLGNGAELTIGPDETTSRLGGGKEKNGQFFISFNQTDQDLLMTGMGVALGVAICSVPVVGTVACAVVGAVISFGMVFVSKYGKCAGNKQLIVHVSPSWSTCR